METKQCKWNQDFHSTKSIEHKLLYEHQTNATNFWKHLKVCMLWRDKALIKCSTALSTGVFIKEWHLKSVTCNDERNVRFCTKNYIFIKAHFRNTPSTCSTKFNLCSELCLYRIQKEEEKKITNENYIYQHAYLFYGIVYIFIKWSATSESWCTSFLRIRHPVSKFKKNLCSPLLPSFAETKGQNAV